MQYRKGQMLSLSHYPFQVILLLVFFHYEFFHCRETSASFQHLMKRWPKSLFAGQTKRQDSLQAKKALEGFSKAPL